MKGISLIAIDLDGTLLVSNGRPAPRGAASLRRAAQSGVHVVPATTRNAPMVRSLCHDLGLDSPMICSNGAQVWATPEGPLWVCHCLPREVALAVAELADRHGWELSTTVGSLTYWRQRPGQPLGLLNPHLTVVASNAEAIVGDPLRILVTDPEAIEAIRSLCEATFHSQCHTETYYHPDGSLYSLGIFAAQADKGTALALVRERLGLAREEVLAIGDNPNDLPLFAQAGLSVAVANAPIEVKERASAVAPANDQEGVAWALERFVLGAS